MRAVSAHETPERAPLRVVPGEEVQIGERDTTWPAFVFVTTDHGRGWVPERHLHRDGVRWVVVTAYDTTELATEVEERLEVVERDDESGWLWCRNAAGGEGWVPVATLAPVS